MSPRLLRVALETKRARDAWTVFAVTRDRTRWERLAKRAEKLTRDAWALGAIDAYVPSPCEQYARKHGHWAAGPARYVIGVGEV